MPTTLWDTFVKGIDTITSGGDTAIASHRRADSSKAPAPIASAVSGVTSVPTAGSEGVDVQGYATVNLLVEFSGPQADADLTLYYYKNGTWYTGEEIRVEAPTGSANVALPPVDTEGFDKVAVQVRATSAVINLIAVFPHNE